jgi:hypothetical protein
MDNSNGGKSEQALRLALSYLEKAQTLTRECEEAHKAGRIQEPEYRSLCEFYARHLEHAQERVDRLRREHRRRAESLHDSIQDAARRQAELADLAAARDIRPHKANKLNRRYTQQIAELRREFQEHSRLASIQDLRELGGAIDVPIDRYAAVTSRRKITLPGIDRLEATAVAVLGSLAVFLPWLSLDGNPRPFEGVPALLGFEARIGSGAVMAVFILFLVLPLAGALFTWMENPRRSGSGMVTVGLSMLAATAVALLVAGVLTTGQVLITDLLRGTRLGAPLYVIAGIEMVLLGIRRARSADATARRGSATVAVTGVIIALAVLGIAFHLATSTGEPHLRFGFSQPDPGTGAIGIVATNDGTASATLYVPWPEGGAESAAVDRIGKAYGLQLYVQERPDAPYRLYPASQDCWLREGRPLTGAGPVEILPNADVAIVLTPFAARQGGIDPHGVRVVATDRQGKTVSTYETALPKR